MGTMTSQLSGSAVVDAEEPSSKWQERMRGLRNMPPVFRMVWDAAPGVVVASSICRLVAALVPLAVLAVTKYVIDSINLFAKHQQPLSKIFWWIVALEFALATLAMISG